MTALLNEVPGALVVAEAADVQGTLEVLRQKKPAVLVLDLSMPGGSGLDVLRQLQKESIKTTVIVLTNYSFPEYEKEARNYGASAFLNKSTQFMQVAELVRELAEAAQAREKEHQLQFKEMVPAVDRGSDDAAAAAEAASPKVRVLVVDDSPTALNWMAMLLSADMRVELVGMAADGKQAIQQVKRLQPDLVVMDLEMPRVNGLEATQVIRSRWPNTQVILTSGNEQAGSLSRSLSAGAKNLLPKHDLADGLSPVLERLFNRKQGIHEYSNK